VKTKTELLKTARSQVPEVTPSELAKELRGRRPVVLDVREKEETDQGILPGSKQVPADTSSCASRKPFPIATRTWCPARS